MMCVFVRLTIHYYVQQVLLFSYQLKLLVSDLCRLLYLPAHICILITLVSRIGGLYIMLHTINTLEIKRMHFASHNVSKYII
jgi:hypothetical protein